jgi:hypothetical protein
MCKYAVSLGQREDVIEKLLLKSHLGVLGVDGIIRHPT